MMYHLIDESVFSTVQTDYGSDWRQWADIKNTDFM